jgi:hypothetical protein
LAHNLQPANHIFKEKFFALKMVEENLCENGNLLMKFYDFRYYRNVISALQLNKIDPSEKLCQNCTASQTRKPI